MKSEKPEVIGLGAGGHAKAVINTLRLMDQFTLVGLLDSRQELFATEVLGVPVLGDDGLIAELYGRGVRHAFIGLGGAGDTGPRRRLYEKARQHGLRIIPAIHPYAVIAPSVEVGCGATIMAGAVINPAARVGDNVIINTGAIVEHDCIISNHVHIASGARLASTVNVGEGAHIGLGACVRQCANIGRNAVVGAGAVVIDDVPDNVVVVGVPSRIVRRLDG